MAERKKAVGPFVEPAVVPERVQLEPVRIPAENQPEQSARLATSPASDGCEQLRNVFRQMRDELGSFIERKAIAEGLVISLLAGHNVLLLGPPGTAKSFMVQSLCERLDGGLYFQRLLTKFTTPEELFGPLKISGLKLDKFERATMGYLPEAHIAFLDEIFKGGSAILNTMLTLLNERIFYNGTTATKCPLVMVVGASNEFGEDDVVALYDRFLLRFEVGYVSDSNMAALLRFKKPQCRARFTLEQLGNARAAVQAVEVPDDVVKTLAGVRRQLRFKSVIPSDRRLCQCVELLRAKAWLDGEPVTDRHLMVLEQALWTKEDERSIVSEVLISRLSEEIGQARRILEGVRKIFFETRQKLNDEPTGEKPQRMRDGFLRGTEEKMKELDALIERTPAGYLAVVKEIQAEVVDMRRDVADAEA